MTVYRQYEAETQRWTSSLGWWHSVLYCHAVCLRTAPLYVEFTSREGWGDSQCLLEAQRLSAAFLFGTPPSPAAIDAAYTHLEEVIPDSETFPDSSAACNTGIVHLYTLSLLRRHDPKETGYVARYCYDIVGAAAGDEVVPAGIMTPAMEVAIGEHRFVQAEISWQSSGRSLLDSVPEHDSVSARQFIDRWTAEPILR